jgi:hypothetical protein
MRHHIKLILLLIVLLPLFSTGQDVNARSPQPDKKTTRLQQKAEKKKEERKVKQENSEAQNLKHAEKIQTKEVRKRMKKSRKKADDWNTHHDSWFKSLFRKKNH